MMASVWVYVFFTCKIDAQVAGYTKFSNSFVDDNDNVSKSETQTQQS